MGLSQLGQIAVANMGRKGHKKQRRIEAPQSEMKMRSG